MVLAEIIYNLRKLIKDSGSDDLQFTDRNLEFIINYLRNKLIRQEIQKGQSISSNIEQSLGIIELELVDKSEDSEFDTGTTILRSIEKIPNLVEVNGKELLTFVGGVDRGNTIDIKPRVLAIKNCNTKYASKRTSAYLFNNRIYVVGCEKELTYITVNGVFSNPREVSKFTNNEGDSCYDIYKDNYPVSSHMLDMINSLVKRQELDLYYQLIADSDNDGQSNE